MPTNMLTYPTLRDALGAEAITAHEAYEAMRRPWSWVSSDRQRIRWTPWKGVEVEPNGTKGVTP